MRKIIHAAAILLVTSTIAVAQGSQATHRNGFLLSLGAGTGSLGSTCNECSSDRQTGLSGFIKLGRSLRSDLFLGLEGSGWHRKQHDVGFNVGFYSAMVQWYPMTGRGIWLNGGAGAATYRATATSDAISVSESESGTGATVGVGYDARLTPHFIVAAYVNAARAFGMDANPNLYQFGLALTWH